MKKNILYLLFFILGLSPVCGQNYIWLTKNDEGKTLVYIDKTRASEFEFEDGESDILEGIAILKKGGKWGAINKFGKVILDFQYDKIFAFYEGYGKVLLNGKLGLIKNDGEWVARPQFDEIDEFSEGFIKVKLNGKYGFIDLNGNLIASCIYDNAGRFYDGFASVRIINSWGFINSAGQIVIPAIYESAGVFSEGVVAVEKNKKFGYVDSENRIIIPFMYDEAYPFFDGEANVTYSGRGRHQDLYIDKYNNHYEWIVYDYTYLKREGGVHRFGCQEYLNPFSNQTYIVPSCKPSYKCVECYMNLGNGYIPYYDTKYDQQFILIGEINEERKYVSAKIYDFIDQEVVPVFDTRIENGIIVGITPVESSGSHISDILLPSIGIATLGMILNEDLSLEKAISCVVKFNLSNVTNSALFQSILNESINLYVSKTREFSVGNVGVDFLTTTVRRKMASQGTWLSSDVENTISFILCLVNN